MPRRLPPTLIAVFALTLAACDASASCEQWLQNDSDHASEVLADLQGGTIEIGGDTLNLSMSGSLGAYDNTEDASNPISTAALFSRRVPEGDFELSFTINEIKSSSVDLAAFVTIQNDGSGKRFMFTQTADGGIATMDREWDPYGRYRFEDEDPTSGSEGVIHYTIRREGWTIYHSRTRGTDTEPSGEGSYDRVSGEAVIAFGLMNRSLAGAAVEGDIEMTVSAASLTTADPDCDADGFE